MSHQHDRTGPLHLPCDAHVPIAARCDAWCTLPGEFMCFYRVFCFVPTFFHSECSSTHATLTGAHPRAPTGGVSEISIVASRVVVIYGLVGRSNACKTRICADACRGCMRSTMRVIVVSVERSGDVVRRISSSHLARCALCRCGHSTVHAACMQRAS